MKKEKRKLQTITKNTGHIVKHIFFVCVSAACMRVGVCVAVWVCARACAVVGVCAGVWLWVSAWCVGAWARVCVCVGLGAFFFFFFFLKFFLSFFCFQKKNSYNKF